jgi:metal-dependent hydrolase (beta-lactamase superfamily II)
MSASAPKSMNVRTYQVGFGDCFLLSFNYDSGKKKHVLIDFGTKALPKGSPKNLMLRIANNIKEVVGDDLVAVVATHRHQDHISGFQRSGGNGSGDVIRSLKPKVVVQPWTEQPDLAQKATKPALRRFGKGAKARVAALSDIHEIASQIAEAARRGRLPMDMRERLSFIGEDNVKNIDAVKNLMDMGLKDPVYVFSGSKSGIDSLLPSWCSRPAIRNCCFPAMRSSRIGSSRSMERTTNIRFFSKASIFTRLDITAVGTQHQRSFGISSRRNRPVQVPRA